MAGRVRVARSATDGDERALQEEWDEDEEWDDEEWDEDEDEDEEDEEDEVDEEDEDEEPKKKAHKVWLKVKHDDKWKRVPFKASGKLTLLQETLKAKMKSDVGQVVYKDPVDGDMIAIHNDSDVKDMIKMYRKNKGKPMEVTVYSAADAAGLQQTLGAMSLGATPSNSMGGVSMERVSSASMRSTVDSVAGWTKGELLGQGAFGRVFSALTPKGQFFAVKQLKLKEEGISKGELETFHKEIRLMQGLKHPNIVAYLGADLRDDEFNIFLEYVPNGSLQSLVKKVGPLSESVLKVYTKQILLGCEYLHANNIIHRDIKGGNILVDNSGQIKLADFGASKKLDSINSQADSFVGTPYWMAPETIRSKGYGRKADVWSIGCTVVELGTGKPPWSDKENAYAAMYFIANSEDPPGYPPNFSQDGTDFLDQCFVRDPENRSNIADLLQHPWLADVEL